MTHYLFGFPGFPLRIHEPFLRLRAVASIHDPVAYTSQPTIFGESANLSSQEFLAEDDRGHALI
jgi:hypothetical protein